MPATPEELIAELVRLIALLGDVLQRLDDWLPHAPRQPSPLAEVWPLAVAAVFGSLVAVFATKRVQRSLLGAQDALERRRQLDTERRTILEQARRDVLEPMQRVFEDHAERTQVVTQYGTLRDLPVVYLTAADQWPGRLLTSTLLPQVPAVAECLRTWVEAEVAVEHGVARLFVKARNLLEELRPKDVDHPHIIFILGASRRKADNPETAARMLSHAGDSAVQRVQSRLIGASWQKEWEQNQEAYEAYLAAIDELAEVWRQHDTTVATAEAARAHAQAVVTLWADPFGRPELPMPRHEGITEPPRPPRETEADA